jgi:hypothetical protein
MAGESIHLSPEPNNAKQQQTSRDENVGQPINAAMLSI